MESQKTPKSQTNPKYKKSNARGITMLDFKLYHRATVTKTGWHWHKNRHEEQWNSTENPDMNLHSYSHLILSKGVKIHIGENSLLNK
jgi:hypothetical protein